KRFLHDLEAARAKAGAPIIVERPVVERPAFDIEKYTEQHPDAQPIQATAAGTLTWTIEPAGESIAPAIGTKIEEGKPACWVQAYYGLEECKALKSGRIVSINAKQGEKVVKGQIVGFIE
ncbi:MAG: oxaloacetate decarboxylase, partial [Bacteroidales bacterium]|nr:oxaloacetate decarboxylase [Bacteroidales bacterium]